MASQPIKVPTPDDILAESLSDKMLSANARMKEQNKSLFKLLDILKIALPAVYLSAHYGNVRCRQAVGEIEKRIKQG